ncbi:MAG: DUF5615 family PIN-like protein [Solirubrobacterales bacterium]|nr:DUF5615 family PIN-like protein [Solirubrobacterales bacterium]
MRLLLDEMLSPMIASGLRELGFDAKAVAEVAEWRGASDPEVLRIASADRRAVVTKNIADFAKLHNWAISPGGEGHCGLVMIPTSQRTRRQDLATILISLEELLLAHPEDDALGDSLIWL